MLTGTVSQELEVKATAAAAWNLLGTLKLDELLVEILPDVFHKVEVLEGDGGVGTVIKATFAPGEAGPAYVIEKFTVVDDEKRVKVVESIEGGQLTLGFTKFRIRFQVSEKDENSCLTKITTEYEIGEDVYDKVSLAGAMPFVGIMNVVADALTKVKKDA